MDMGSRKTNLTGELQVDAMLGRSFLPSTCFRRPGHRFFLHERLHGTHRHTVAPALPGGDYDRRKNPDLYDGLTSQAKDMSGRTTGREPTSSSATISYMVSKGQKSTPAVKPEVLAPVGGWPQVRPFNSASPTWNLQLPSSYQGMLNPFCVHSS